MYRTLLTFSKILLEPRAITGMSEVRTLTPTYIYDIRRENHVIKYPNLPVTNRLHPLLLNTDNKLFAKQNVRWTTRKGFQGSQIIYNLINMVKRVDLNELIDAPPAAFWTATGISTFQLGIPFLEMIHGAFCPFVTILQLNVAAVTLGLLDGMKWGFAVSNDPEPTPTRNAIPWGLLPPALAITGLLLPYPLGFVAVGSGMMTSLYLGLKSCVYPPWASAVAVVISVSTVIGLLFAMLVYALFDNRLMNSEKGDGQDKEPEEDPTYGEENNSGNNAGGSENNKASDIEQSAGIFVFKGQIVVIEN